MESRIERERRIGIEKPQREVALAEARLAGALTEAQRDSAEGSLAAAQRKLMRALSYLSKEK